jgi:Flp pilus assembly pilin Flp
MTGLLRGIKKFFLEEKGASAVEYGVLIALISAAIILGLQLLGTHITSSLENPGIEAAPIKP